MLKRSAEVTCIKTKRCRKIRICFLGDGQSIHTLRWIRYFIKKKHEVFLITTSEVQVKGANVINLSARVSRFPKFMHDFMTELMLIIEIRRIRPDILHAHFLTRYGIMGYLSGFRPLVISLWGSDILFLEKRRKMIKRLARRALRKADAIHSVSNQITDKVAGITHRRDNIITFSEGVEITDNKRWKKPKLIGNLRYKNIVISARAFNKVYDLFTLVKAVPLVLKKNKDVIFLMANDGVLLPDVIKEINRLGVQDRIILLGKLEEKELCRYFAHCGIYVSTSISDGSSITLHQAQLCGAFPICTDIESNRDWIKDGVNGLLFKTSSPNDLARKILKAIDSPKMLYSAKRVNYNLVKDRADFNKNHKDMEKLYYRLIK